MAPSAEYTDFFRRENFCLQVYFPDPNLVSEEPTAFTIVELSESSPVYVVIDVSEADSCVVVDIAGRPELSGHLFHLLVFIYLMMHDATSDMEEQVKDSGKKKTTEVP